MKRNILKLMCLVIIIGYTAGCSEEVMQDSNKSTTTTEPSTSIKTTSSKTTTTTTTTTTSSATTSTTKTHSIVSSATTTKSTKVKTTKKKTTKKASKQASSNLPLKAICNDGTISYQYDASKKDYRGMCSKHRGIRQKLGRVK